MRPHHILQYIFIGSGLALLPAIPAFSQSGPEYIEFLKRCRAAGGTPNGDPSNPECIFGIPGPPPKPDIYIPPPPNPVAEQLKSDIASYEYSMNAIREHTRSVDPFLRLPRPASGIELSGRLDSVLSTLWPEFRSAALEADLLRRQSAFFDSQNSKLRGRATWQHDSIARLHAEIPALRQQITAAEARLPAARRREAEANALALVQLNDRTSERRTIATIVAFAAEPYATVGQMDDSFRYTTIPGPAPTSGPGLMAAGLAPGEAADREPTGYAALTMSQPASGAPMAEKLDTFYRVANGLRQDVTALPYLRSDLPNKRAENIALVSQTYALDNELWGLDRTKRELDHIFSGANARVDAAIASSVNAEAIIFREILADLILENAADKMREIADNIAGTAGIKILVPPTDSKQLLDYVRRGGHLLLPVEGYRAQWDAFNEVQQKAIEGLGKTQRLASEAAQALAYGSPGEAEALMERVFGTVKWQVFDYAKTTGLSALPEDEDKPWIVDWFERYAEKRRQREAGD